MDADRNVIVIEDIKGNSVVLINDIVFKGRRNIDWDEVEKYIYRYAGSLVEIAETKDIVYIGTDLADEYARSKYTAQLKGSLAKAKANAAQGIPEMIEIATNPSYKENLANKHNYDARYGWFRYQTRFAIPMYDETGTKIKKHNQYIAELLIRHAADNKLYLYDIMKIKKETSTPL